MNRPLFSTAAFVLLLPLAILAQTSPRLVNLSTRTEVGAGSNAAYVNFAIEGAASKTILLRGVGPTLGLFGVPGVLSDPILTVFDRTGAAIGENDNWTGQALQSAFVQVGAFGLSAGSKDAALLLTLSPGVYTARVAGVGGATGSALSELYETDATPRLVYIAARAQSGSGGSTLVAGFVLSGQGTGSPLLVRALGPALAARGLTGALGNPSLSLFSGASLIGTNDNWSGTPLSDAGMNAGLMTLTPGSGDAALLATLAAGPYTVQVGSGDPGNRIGLVEMAHVDANRAAAFAPALILPPSSVSASLGQSVTLSAFAIGKPTPTFQWRRNGAALPGATNATLTLASFQAGDVGNYSVVMANSAGTTSSVDYVTSLAAPIGPTILTPPADQAVPLNGTATFTVIAGGAPPFSYQWLFNGAALAGATNAAFVRSNVQTAHLGTYSVRVTNAQGSVTSANAALSLAVPPTIVSHPTDFTSFAGTSAQFSVTALGSPLLMYQWQRDGIAIAGATNATQTFPVVQLSDAGNYACRVTNNGGTITSNAARLTVNINYSGTYFGTFDGNRGSWAFVVRSDGLGTFIGYLNNPKSAIVITAQLAPNGSFHGPGTLLQPEAGSSFALTGSVGIGTVTGTLQGLNVSFSGTADPANGATAALSGMYQASGPNPLGSTFLITGPSGRSFALTTGAALLDAGLGTVGVNGVFAVTTADNTKFNGTVTPGFGSVTATITPSSAPAVTINGALTNGLGAPTIVIPPGAREVLVNSLVSFSVTAGGRTPLLYQWRRDDAVVAGATQASLTLPGAQFTDAGNYTCAVTNLDGTIISPPARLSVIPSARLINLSLRTDLAAAGETVTLGYVVGGAGTSGNSPLLIRAVGPSLQAFGVTGTVDDPKLELYDGSTKTAENDNWGGSAALSTAFQDVGAFPFSALSSKDAAVSADIASPNNSVKISATGSGTGTVLAELYDATPDPRYTLTTRRLINVSVLKQLGSGFTVGFVIGGTGNRNVLVRAVGPGLAAAGVSSGTVSDPKIALFAGSTKIDENDNWSGTPALTTAMTATGAFAIPPASRDAALLASLQPGSYSVQVSGVGGASDLLVVEVYEAP